jgi:hypothetical protein
VGQDGSRKKETTAVKPRKSILKRPNNGVTPQQTRTTTTTSTAQRKAHNKEKAPSEAAETIKSGETMEKKQNKHVSEHARASGSKLNARASSGDDVKEKTEVDDGTSQHKTLALTIDQWRDLCNHAISEDKLRQGIAKASNLSILKTRYRKHVKTETASAMPRPHRAQFNIHNECPCALCVLAFGIAKSHHGST